jgi:hypothetical protein
MKKLTVERKSRVILGILSLMAILFYLAFIFGSASWMTIGAITVGILLAFLLYAESQVITYFKEGQYKKISLGDIVVWLTTIVATIILINSIALIPTIGTVIPASVITFTKSIAVLGAVIGFLLALVHIFTPRFK